MADNLSHSGGRRKSWPEILDRSDPEGVADFLIALGYDRDNVARAVEDHCALDRVTAGRIVDDVATQQQQGG